MVTVKIKKVDLICQTSKGTVHYIINLKAQEIQKYVVHNEFETETRIKIRNAYLPPPYNCDCEELNLQTLTTKNIVKFFEPLIGANDVKAWIVTDGLIFAKFNTFEEFKDCVWGVVNRIRKWLRNGK